MALPSTSGALKQGVTCNYVPNPSLSRNVGTPAQTRGDLRKCRRDAPVAVFGDRQTFPLRGYVPKRGICGRTRADLRVPRWQSGGNAFDARSLETGCDLYIQSDPAGSLNIGTPARTRGDLRRCESPSKRSEVAVGRDPRLPDRPRWHCATRHPREPAGQGGIANVANRAPTARGRHTCRSDPDWHQNQHRAVKLYTYRESGLIYVPHIYLSFSIRI